MDERQTRVGQNEATFREINERIEALNEAFAVVTETFDVVCECADSGCIKANFRFDRPLRARPRHRVCR